MCAAQRAERALADTLAWVKSSAPDLSGGAALRPRFAGGGNGAMPSVPASAREHGTLRT
jgi:hypothetical protein